MFLVGLFAVLTALQGFVLRRPLEYSRGTRRNGERDAQLPLCEFVMLASIASVRSMRR